ncbi:hypothetical protein GCM10023259_031810 [Thermocatellispora tengchongensis]
MLRKCRGSARTVRGRPFGRARTRGETARGETARGEAAREETARVKAARVETACVEAARVEAGLRPRRKRPSGTAMLGGGRAGGRVEEVGEKWKRGISRGPGRTR